MFRVFSLISILLTILVACGGDSSNNGGTDSQMDTVDQPTIDNTEPGNFIRELYSSDLTSQTEVSCTLENGSATMCYQLTFIANGVGDTVGTGTVGPFCPESITTPRNQSGVGVYDGATNPGFQSLVDAATSMDADGYDIVDADGNINTNDLTTREEAGLSYCLNASFDNSLEITYLVPIIPERRTTPAQIATVGSIGFGLNGVPFKGDPPSVTVAEPGIGGTGSGNIPAIDMCGGHADPAGYYHWHFVPQSMNTLLASEPYNYTELYGMTCTNSNINVNNPTMYSGIAKDGYPIYGTFDSVNSVNTQPDRVATVDECNGHEHATPEFPNGVYHYHALNTAPNVPECLMGSFVNRNDFSIR